MFWRYNLITGSCIDSLLDKEDVSLRELMDEDDILQECKAQTKKLIDFLVQPEILDELVTLITEEPADESDEKLLYKYPNRACELLTFDIAEINDALASNEALLNKLYNFLKKEKPLNPLLASFFSKTISLLISKRTEQVFCFLKEKDFVSLALNHLNTSAIVDLILSFVTSIENSEYKCRIVEWLNEQKLIQQLIRHIDVEYEEEEICNASYAVCQIIKACREHMSMMQEKAEISPLLKTVESVEVISDLLERMFRDIREDSAVVNGILVIIELLIFKKQGLGGVQQLISTCNDKFGTEDIPQSCCTSIMKGSEPDKVTSLDAERLSSSVNNVVLAVLPRLQDFHSLLFKPPVKSAISLTFGKLDPPFGRCRLEVVNLLTVLISTNNHVINAKLASLGTISVLMDLFFKYPWNNFLHAHVENAIGKIITNPPTVDDEGNKVHPLLDQLLSDYKITVKILENFEEKPEKPGKNGYRGHLVKIANCISENSEDRENSNLISSKLKELPEEHQDHWHTFVSQTLASINKITASQVALSDCNMREITSSFVDQFGFHDDEFGDSDEGFMYTKNSMNPLPQSFPINDGNSLRSAEIFEEVCRVKISSDRDGVLRSDREDSTSFDGCFSSKPSDENSSDSDDDSQVFEPGNTSIDLSADEHKMEVDNNESMFGGVPMEFAPAPLQNPWESAEGDNSSSDGQGNWADFGNFADFGSSDSKNPFSPDSTVSDEMETSYGGEIDSNATSSAKLQAEMLKQRNLTGLLDEETQSAPQHKFPD